MNLDNFVNLDDYESERTIVDIYDSETGEQLNADDLLDGNEEGLNMQIRSGLVLAQKSGEYKYCCSYCNQPLSLTRRRLSYGGYSIYYFAHFKNSADCPIKTVNDKGNPYGWAKNVYLGRKGGKLHQDMQNALMNVLQTVDGFSEPKAFEVIKDKSLADGWRRPDVVANYQNNFIVFEFQLCSTFINGILDKIAFYKILSMNLVWLFPKFDKTDQELCEKDTFYSHNRNVFVFDAEKYYKDGKLPFEGYQCAQEASRREGKLMLNAWWQTPKVVGETVTIEWHHKLISFDELTINTKNNEIYYHNSDYDFYEAADEEERKVIDEWERIKSERWAKIWHNVKLRQERFLREQQQNEEEQRVRRLLRELHSGTRALEPFKGENGLWGYKVENLIVIQPRFTEITSFCDGIAWVKMTSWGAINFVGKKVVNFNYSELTSIKENLHIVRDKSTKFYFIVNQKGVKISKPYDEIKCENPYNNRLKEENLTDCIDHDRPIEPCDVLLAKKEKWGIISLDDDVLVDFRYDDLSFSGQDKFRARMYVRFAYDYEIIDKKGNVTLSEVKKCGPIEIGKAFNHWGILDSKSVWFNRFDLREISYIGGDCYYVTRDYKFCTYFEIITLDRTVVSDKSAISVLLLENKYFKITNSSGCGLYSTDGTLLIPTSYNDISILKEGYATITEKTWEGPRYGVCKMDGTIVLEPIYKSVSLISSEFFDVQTEDGYFERYNFHGKFIPRKKISISDNLYVAKKSNLFGLLNSEDEILVPYNYTKYEGVNNKNIICFSKNGVVDYYNFNGKLLTLEKYSLDVPCGLHLTRSSNGWNVVDSDDNVIQSGLSYEKIKNLAHDRLLIGSQLYNYEGNKILYDGVNPTTVMNPKQACGDNQFIVETSISGKEHEPYLLDVVALKESALSYKLRGASYTGDGYFIKCNYRNSYWNEYSIYDINGVELYQYRGKEMIYLGDSVFWNGENYMTLPLEAERTEPKIQTVQSEIHNYRYTDTMPSNEYGIVVSKTIIGTRTHRYGISTTSGIELLPSRFIEIKRSGSFFEVREDKTWTVYYWDGTSMEESSFIPRQIYKFNEDLLVEVSNNQQKRLLLTHDGKHIVISACDEIRIIDETHFLTTNAGNRGVFDWNGECVIPNVYEDIIAFRNNIYKVRTNNKWGLVSSDNHIIIEPEYESINSFIGKYCIVLQDKKTGVVDIDGNSILPCKYDAIKPFIHGVAIVKGSDGYGLANMYGDIVVEPIYDSIEPNKDGFYIGKLGEQSILYDATGHVFIPLGDYKITDIGSNQALLSKEYKKVNYTEIYNYEKGFTKHPISNIADAYVLTKLFNLYGLCDTQLKECVSCSYVSIRYINDETLIVAKFLNQNICYGVITLSEETILECSYKAIIIDKENTYIFYVQSHQNGKWAKCMRQEKPTNFCYRNIEEARNPQIAETVINTEHLFEGVVCGKAPFGVFVKIPKVGKGLLKTSGLKKMGMNVFSFNKGMKVRVTIIHQDKTKGHITLKLEEIIH